MRRSTENEMCGILWFILSQTLHNQDGFFYYTSLVLGVLCIIGGFVETIRENFHE